MRIGIDASCWSNRRGFGRFTRSLLAELVPLSADRGHETVLVADAATIRDADLPADAAVVAVSMGAAPSLAAAAGGSRGLADMARMSVASTRVRADVFFFPATYSYVPVLGTRLVVTAHDATAEALPELIVPTRLDRWRWEAKQRLALRQAALVLSVSEAAREDVVEVLGVDRRRTRVVHEAADGRFVPAEARGAARPRCLDGLDGRPYLLYVGGFSPHKNLETLVRAFAQVRAGCPDAVLVLAGDADGDPFLSSTTEVRREIAALPGGAVHVTGYVDDNDLVLLYQGAVATVLVSLAEGFGLPVAESLACGTPVVVSDLPALRELVGEAGIYVDPTDEGQIAAAILATLSDPGRRDLLGATGLDRMRARSWAAAATTVLDVLEEAGA